MSIWRGLTRNRARTFPEADDPRLRGRAYAVPYVRVWEAVMEIASKRARWRIVEADPHGGTVRAEARTLLWRFVDDVEVTVSLDDHGRTRVDLSSASRVGSADLGANARRIARFLHALDRRLRQGARGRSGTST